MTTSTHRPGVAPLLTAVAEAPQAAGAAPAGVHVTTILNIALLQLEHPGAPAARTAPVAGVRAASGALIVDGIVFPGLRFGS